MWVKRLRTIGLIIVVLAFLGIATGATAGPAASTLAGPCTPSAAYDPACDVDHDGDVDIFDIQLSAGHWGQAGTWMSDNDHNHLGQTWTGNNNPLKITGSFSNSFNRAPLILGNSSPFGSGLRVEAAGADGVGLYSVGNDGVYVSSAGGDGVQVNSAGGNGLNVTSASGDGVYVSSAGDDGVQVNWAADSGLRVDSASGYGVLVLSSALSGLYVGSAGYRGLEISSADTDGVHITQAGNNGVLVASAGDLGVYANTTRASGEWGLLTPDKISGSNITLSSMTIIARVTGDHPLTTGDVVAAVGVADPLPDSTVPLALVRLADVATDKGIVGVVEGRMALTAGPQREHDQDATPFLELRSAEGSAESGDYVALTVLGVTQVKVDASADIQPGQRLTASNVAGHARALRTENLNGMVITEGTPVIGIALAVPEAGKAIIPVFVTLR
ncbi:MAG: hypothetical protein V2I51_23965 [Anderseniella sp.]|jgi:hypothetical protein|nr:hypothetical protein [Anderseniella sp.]